MADTVAAQVTLSVSARKTKDLDLSDPVDSIAKAKRHSLTTLGAGALAYNQQWADSRTLAAASNDDMDLAGSLTDAFGASVALVRFKVLGIWSTNANTADTHLSIGAAASNPLADLFAATPDILKAPRSGGSILIAAADATGYPVAAGSADALRVTNASAGTAATFDIVILGATS